MANGYNLITELDETSLYISTKQNDPQKCLNDLGDVSSQLTIISQNIRSIQKNFDNFTVFISCLNFLPDLIILTECRLSDVTPVFGLENYECFYSKRYLNQNDGIAVFFKSSLQVKIDEPPFKDANCLLIHVSEEFMICALYRSPSFHNIFNFCNSLEKIMQSNESTANCIIVGDINIDIGIDSGDNRVSDYLDITGHHGYYPGHRFPTRDRTCLDHVLLKTKRAARVIICNSGITDHDTVIVGIAKCTPCVLPGNNNRVKIDYPNLSKAITESDWSHICNYSDVTEAVTEFTRMLSETISAFTTTETIRNSKAIKKPWITKGLLKCIRKRDLLHMEAKKAMNKDNSIIQQRYKTYRNFCNNLIQNLKTENERKLLEDANGDSKKTWMAIKNICNIQNKSQSGLELLQTNPDPIESLNSVNEYFTKVGEQLAEKTLLNLKKTEAELAAMAHFHDNNPSSESFFATPTDDVEVKKIISNLKDSSSPGWDGVTNRMLKLCINSLAAPITFLCNLSISTGVVPTQMKTANVCPIFKSGDKTAPSNYRPISLLTSLSKILEKIMNSRLLSFLEKNGLISENQYGFRKNRSTEDAVTNLVDFVVNKVDNGYKCTGVFLDLAKAFDTVSRHILLKKMEAVGIRGLALQWFRSYLTNRTQRVRMSDKYSGYATLNYGVPQGSVLGPTLFILYINSLCTLELHQAKIFAYADDTAMIFFDKTWEGVQEAANMGVNLVSSWLNHNLLTLNVSKTKVVNFSVTKRTSCPDHLSLKLHSCDCNEPTRCVCPRLEQVKHIRYLGVHIDQYLKWTKQIEHVSGRVRKLIHIFKRMGRIAGNTVLNMLYHTLCQSVLSYCIITWGASHKTHLMKVERAQRALLKVTYNKPIRFSTDTLYRETCVLRVRQLYILAVTLRYHKNSHNLVTYTNMRSLRNASKPKWHRPKCKLSFGNRCFLYMGPFIYNKLNGEIDILTMTRNKCKKHVSKFLTEMDYESTEKFLNS